MINSPKRTGIKASARMRPGSIYMDDKRMGQQIVKSSGDKLLMRDLQTKREYKLDPSKLKDNACGKYKCISLGYRDPELSHRKL